jgi:hypothetical protein
MSALISSLIAIAMFALLPFRLWCDDFFLHFDHWRLIDVVVLTIGW